MAFANCIRINIQCLFTTGHATAYAYITTNLRIILKASQESDHIIYYVTYCISHCIGPKIAIVTDG